MTCVLIVEDETFLLMAAQAVLERHGFETVAAGSVNEADNVIRSGQSLDLVFTDLRLGDDINGGVAVGQRAAEAKGQIPVLYTSAYRLDAMMLSLSVDARTFLPKPYSEQELTASIGKVLSGQEKTSAARDPLGTVS